MDIGVTAHKDSGYKIYTHTSPTAIDVQQFVKYCIQHQLNNSEDTLRILQEIIETNKQTKDTLLVSLVKSVAETIGSYLIHTSLEKHELPPTPITVLRNTTAHEKELTKNPPCALVAVVVITKMPHSIPNTGIDSTVAYLMGFRTRKEFYHATVSMNGIESIPFRSQICLRSNLLSISEVRNAIDIWKSTTSTLPSTFHTPPLLQQPTKRKALDQDYVEDDLPHANLINARYVQHSTLVCDDITRLFSSPIYIFSLTGKHAGGHGTDNTEKISVLRMLATIRNTCFTYSKLFSEWKAMIHGHYGNVTSSFLPCAGMEHKFGKICARIMQWDAENSCIYGSVSQTLQTSFISLHIIAQASALLILRQSDFGMRNWLVLCWAIHTKLRLTYVLHSKSCDYSTHRQYLQELGLEIRNNREWCENPPSNYTDAQLKVVLEETLRSNGILWPPIGWKSNHQYDVSSRSAMDGVVLYLLENGVNAICAAVYKYVKGFARLEATDGAQPIPEYLTECYKEAMAAYALSCNSISRLVDNGFTEFMKQRWKSERRGVPGEIPEMKIPTSFERDDFGFPVYDPCKEDNLETCICGVHKMRWRDAFEETIGFHFPTSQK